MKKTILALSIVLASSSVFAKPDTRNQSSQVKEVSQVEEKAESAEREIYLTVSNIEIEDSVEYLTFGVGGQSIEKNALYTQIGGQFSTLSDAPSGISEKIINLETKIGYSFNGEDVAFIPYVGASVGVLMYEIESRNSTVSDTEFLTRLFVGAEFRVADTVGIYFNTGVVTVFDTNLDFSEIGLKVSF
ncbi:hypothetical protein PE36_00265 [Moritella sp. PE36]|uniref:outer membrane beta-barrel protein n=1 Tax=Moritella sp. PE36 TaxID=58051 RepID=UPI00015693D1|nr:outer membrane beta-barrel protein [Moritella sp. PE36]EDM66184.1 hypothetical protein PE36_00265 [Moritella sp. PE36]